MMKEDSVTRGQLITAMDRLEVFVLADEKTDGYYCTLTPEQEPGQRLKAQERIATKRALTEETRHLQNRLKSIKSELEGLQELIDDDGTNLNYSPPQGRFVFTGKYVASALLRRAWLVDLDTDLPIIETLHELTKDEILRIDSIRQSGEQLALFPSDTPPTEDVIAAGPGEAWIVPGPTEEQPPTPEAAPSEEPETPFEAPKKRTRKGKTEEPSN